MLPVPSITGLVPAPNTARPSRPANGSRHRRLAEKKAPNRPSLSGKKGIGHHGVEPSHAWTCVAQPYRDLPAIYPRPRPLVAPKMVVTSSEDNKGSETLALQKSEKTLAQLALDDSKLPGEIVDKIHNLTTLTPDDVSVAQTTRGGSWGDESYLIVVTRGRSGFEEVLEHEYCCYHPQAGFVTIHIRLLAVLLLRLVHRARV